MKIFYLLFVLNLVSLTTDAQDTFTPYSTPAEVPQSATDLWQDYDARKEPLNVQIIKEWKTEGVVTQYLTFTVGTFKGSESRIAAYYSYPDNGQRNAAFVWSHGGGQRAERGRGVYFAKQGFTTIDINWLGRPMEKDLAVNTDWGKVDPSQGPRFYAKALRKGWKRNLLPDEYTIDPVPSPRNANWFLLTVAGRRAITFLEQQPEVDPKRIGFTGYSMGGMITALTAIDKRLKAVAPFVGGTGFKYVDFPGGIQGSSIKPHFQNLELYKNTIDASAYWPSVKCPVMFISSSNDFHSTFERIYQSMNLLKHKNWRVTTNVHYNHGPGPEQWVMLNLWFKQYLKGIDQKIPATPASTLTLNTSSFIRSATFTVTPSDQEKLVNTEIYYSYDPNSRTRFWIRANEKSAKGIWSAQAPLHADLPIYFFAICRYQLDKPQILERGETNTFVLNSEERSFLPESINLASLKNIADPGLVFEDFSKGSQDWSSRDQRSIKTYKFQNPKIDRSDNKKLSLQIDPKGRQLALRLNVSSQFLSRENNLGSFSYTTRISGDQPRELVISAGEFKSTDNKKLEWSKIATFEVILIDDASRAKIDLTSPEGHAILKQIRLID